MSIMQQSSKANDRTLGVWFQNIQQGLIKLPRFQRFEAWDKYRIQSFLNTIINNLPVGVTLSLDVAGHEQFVSRYIVTAEPKVHGVVNQHLLDGQQRLTAFWRAMHNNYEWDTYFVYIPKLDTRQHENTEIEAHGEPRWFKEDKQTKKQKRMPLWADIPSECLNRGMIPASLLCPGDHLAQIEQWLNDATLPLRPTKTDPDAFAKLEHYTATKDKIKSEITLLRERVTHFNLPYLSLPADTKKEIALQVFINMNTNSKPLSQYDIIVAEVESVAEQSLHDLEASLTDKSPTIKRYGSMSNLILSTSALLQEKLPNTRGMIEMDKKVLLDKWPVLERGLERMASFLNTQGIFDESRLPTNAVLAVIAASYEQIPDDGDFLAKAEKLLRRYMWSAFFSNRYENSAATRAFADFKAIKSLLKNQKFTEEDINTVPALNRQESPLVDVESLMVAGWPKASGIEARAILAITTYLGAIDFADHKQATYESIQNREYHHIFPESLLAEANIKANWALNCALVTWKTNRIIGRKDPMAYLKERVNWVDELTVQERLKSHLISYDYLSKANYENLAGVDFEDKVKEDFNLFLRDRAELVMSAMLQLVSGNNPTIDSLWASHLEAVSKH